MQYRIKMKSNKYWHYIRYFCWSKSLY